MIDKIQIEEQILFKEWEQYRKPFSIDGILNFQEYDASDPKLLFILKETNSKKGKSINLKELLNQGGERMATWDNVARWVYGINNLEKDIKWSELENRDFLKKTRKKLLPSICVINLKKSSGVHTTDPNELKTIAEKDKEYLNRQFNLYYNNLETRPDYIICGGSVTSSTFNKLVAVPDKKEWQSTSHGIKYFKFDKERVFISFAHPEARVQDSLLYYGLIDAIKEIKGINS